LQAAQRVTLSVFVNKHKKLNFTKFILTVFRCCLWLNKTAKKAIKKRNKRWKRYRCTKSDADYERYNVTRNQKKRRKARKVRTGGKR